MNLKYSFEIVDIGNEIVAVPIEDSAVKMHAVLKFNRTGREVFALMQEPTTEEAIVNTLAEKYPNQLESMTTYVHTFVQHFRDWGLIEE